MRVRTVFILGGICWFLTSGFAMVSCGLSGYSQPRGGGYYQQPPRLVTVTQTRVTTTTGCRSRC